MSAFPLQHISALPRAAATIAICLLGFSISLNAVFASPHAGGSFGGPRFGYSPAVRHAPARIAGVPVAQPGGRPGPFWRGAPNRFVDVSFRKDGFSRRRAARDGYGAGDLGYGGFGYGSGYGYSAGGAAVAANIGNANYVYGGVGGLGATPEMLPYAPPKFIRIEKANGSGYSYHRSHSFHETGRDLAWDWQVSGSRAGARQRGQDPLAATIERVRVVD